MDLIENRRQELVFWAFLVPHTEVEFARARRSRSAKSTSSLYLR